MLLGFLMESQPFACDVHLLLGTSDLLYSLFLLNCCKETWLREFNEGH